MSDLELKEEKKGKPQRNRNWCFTDFEVEKGPIVFDESKMRYLVFQKEKCPETGRLHYQGFVQFHKQQWLAGCQKCLGRDKKMHANGLISTPQQAAAYAKKEESRVEGPWEYGQMLVQGTRTDLQIVADDIVSKAPLREVALKYPATYISNWRGMEKLSQLVNPASYRQKPEVLYLWGEPGVGKSRWVREHVDPTTVYFYRDNEHGWFDGYLGQECVVVDEFMGLTPISHMLQLIDYGAVSQPVKGGFVPIRAHKWIFTSNKSPEHVYYYNEAWLRRVKEFFEVKEIKKDN